MSEPQIEPRSAQPYLRIAGRIEDDVSAFVDAAFKELYDLPVDAKTDGDGRVSAGELPAGRYLTYLHHGEYHPETGPDLLASLAELTDWAAQNGIEHSSWFLERYLIGPETEPDEAKWLTEFAYLVVDD